MSPPRATEVCLSLEDSKSLFGTVLEEVMGAAYARNPCSDDQNIEMLDRLIHAIVTNLGFRQEVALPA